MALAHASIGANKKSVVFVQSHTVNIIVINPNLLTKQVISVPTVGTVFDISA